MRNKSKAIRIIIAAAGIALITAAMVFLFSNRGSEYGKIIDVNGTVLYDGKTYTVDKKTENSVKNIVDGMNGKSAENPYKIYSDKIKPKKLLNLISKNGKNIYLTIDSSVNRAAYEAFNGDKGAIIIYNYKTGKTVCQFSSSGEENSSADKTVNENYTPGSIMKIVTSVSALKNIPDINLKNFDCIGFLKTKDGTITCSGVHGTNDFRNAFKESCNCAYAEISSLLGADKLYSTACELGFNKNIMSDGILLKKSEFNPFTDSETDLGWAGIGQYTTKVTPAHFLSIVGAVANNGVGYSPSLIHSIGTDKGSHTESPAAVVNIDSKISEQLASMMRSNVATKYGDTRFENLEMCGKTGTAGVEDELQRPHSWFAGFSTLENFPYAVVCVVENGGAGSGVAMEISNETLQFLYNSTDGE